MKTKFGNSVMHKSLQCIIALLILTSSSTLALTYQATPAGYESRADLGVTVFEAKAILPAEGYWYIPPGQLPDDIAHAYLAYPTETLLCQGVRQKKIQKLRRLNDDKGFMHRVFWTLNRYAHKHDGIAPDKLNQLDKIYLGSENQKRLKTGHYGLIPKITILTQSPDNTNRMIRVNNKTPLLYELRPAYDDGKQFVLYADGSVSREAINTNLMNKLGFKVSPTKRPDDDVTELHYSLLLHTTTTTPQDLTVNITNILSNVGAKLHCSLNPAEYKDSDKPIKDWASQRMQRWTGIYYTAPNTILSYLSRSAASAYGLEEKVEDVFQIPGRNRNNNNGETTTIFNLLGGRSAIRETLQLQDISANADQADTTTVPIKTIQGITVKSHPYKQMLKGRTVPEFSLANVVPHDRMMLWFANPKAILNMLDGGSEFIFNAGSGFTGHRVKYDLLGRYLTRFGFSESWMRALLKAEIISESAIILPDLFLIDGTEITIACRLKNPQLDYARLALFGIRNLSSSITKTEPTVGNPVFYACQHDILFISTSRQELQLALNCAADKKHADSLGHSAEFRYMLTCLPATKSTETYAYISDPFIRRLTGPATKIGQLRRLKARFELESIATAALLRRFDNPGATPTLEELIRLKYVPAPNTATDAILHPDGTATSATYGSPTGMHTLEQLNITTASQAEAKGYREYCKNYTRFWRQYFDPIAIRLNHGTAPKSYNMTTFILPLIDTSIYDSIRQGVQPAGLAPLKVPQISPQPIAMASVNLRESSLLAMLSNSYEMLGSIGMQSRIFDALDSQIHLVLPDAAPIIGTGSGSITDIFGTIFAGVDGEEMLAIATMISAFTRPCHILIHLSDRDAALQAMRRMPTGKLRLARGFLSLNPELYQEGHANRWIYTLSIENVLHIRFGIEIQGDYLVISNQPESNHIKITGAKTVPNNAIALQLMPEACKKQMPSLYTAAMEQDRAIAMHAITSLWPLMGGDRKMTTKDAYAWYQQKLGFTPLPPTGDTIFKKDSMLKSQKFGYPGKTCQPAYNPNNRDFGLMHNIRKVDLSAQFEDDGLRATINWQTL